MKMREKSAEAFLCGTSLKLEKILKDFLPFIIWQIYVHFNSSKYLQSIASSISKSALFVIPAQFVSRKVGIHIRFSSFLRKQESRAMKNVIPA